jgi:large subunit ribosomal protein L24
VQTTLLGFAIGIILALLAALVGPLFIDWNNYRAQFEREAARLVGLPVRVGGAIEVSLLPTPSIELQKVEIGRVGEDAMRVRALGIEFALGSLVRGQVRATQMRVAAPELIISIDRDGRAALPAGALGFDPDALSVERLNVEDARIVLMHVASGERMTLDKLWFRGEMRSLAGSFRGEGAFVSRRDLYGYRIAASRQDRGTRVRFSLDPSGRTLAAEGEGTVTMDGGMPKFDGALTLIRPVGIARAAGKTVIDDPWRVSARVKADAASASFEQIEFQYGPDERALKLSGNAALKSDGRLRLEGALSASQLDLDRLVATPGQSRPQPVATLRGFVEKFAGVLRPPFPVRLGLNVDLLTVGGAPLQGLKGEIKADNGGWDLDGFELRAPGLTQVRLGGRVELTGSGIAFRGPAALSAADPRQLLAWLEGREEMPTNGATRPLRAQGDIVLGNETIAIERFNAEIDRKTVAGRLAYRWPRDAQKARLDAELNAAELDVDSLIGASKNVLEGAKFDRPGEISLALDIARAKIAGVDAQRTTAKLQFDADGLNVERLSFGDFGGVSLEGSGRIDLAQSPRGSLAVDLDARDMAGVAALLDRFAPAELRGARHAIGRLGATKLRATLDIAEAADKGKLTARLAVQGQSGNTRMAMNADATGALDNLAQAQIKLTGNLEGGADGVLWRLLGLDQTLAPAPGAGRLAVEAEGPLDGELRFESRIASDLLDAGGKGNLRLGETGRARFDLAVTRADLRKLAKFSGVSGDLSRASFASHVVYDGSALSFTDIAANVAGSPLRGSLALEFGSPLRISGDLDAGSADAAALFAAATGAPARAGSAERWASEPFGGGLFADMAGRVDVKAGEIALTPSVSLKDARAGLKFAASQIAIENIEGTLAGGKVSGEMFLSRAADGGVGLKARLAIAGADAALAILPQLRPVAGQLGLKIELEGAGRSPKALVGSLAGAGTLSLDRAQLRGLDPAMFTTLVREADRGMPLDAAKIHAATLVALDAGRLEIAHLEGALAVAGGQARLSTVTARTQGADLAMSGSLDLADLYLDARLVLAYPGESGPIGRPEITVSLKGDAASPQRAIDSAAFAGWLALRAVEQQSKKLEAIESGRGGPRETTQSISPPSAAMPGHAAPDNIVLPRPRPMVTSPPPPRTQERAAPLPPAINIAPLPGARKPAHVPAPRTVSPPG